MKKIMILALGSSILMFSSCKKKIDSCIESSKSTVLVGDVVNFTNCTEKYLTTEWNFGDGENTMVANPSHVFETGGNYTVTLKATNKSGNSDEITQSVKVIELKLKSIMVEDADFNQAYPLIDMSLGDLELSASRFNNQTGAVTFTNHPSVSEALIGFTKTLTFTDPISFPKDGFVFSTDKSQGVYSSSFALVNDKGAYIPVDPYSTLSATDEKFEIEIKDVKGGITATFVFEE